jgi:hypothetical protein
MRTWRLIPLLAVALFPAVASATTSSTTLRVSAMMPSKASVGVEKLTGTGARPGLVLTGPIEARIATLAVGHSKTVTLKVTVRGTPHGSAYFGPGSYNIGPSINLRSPTVVHIRGAGSNVSKPNITLS